MAEKSFAEVMERFRSIVIDERFDMVVAIANGGIVPAGIIAQQLGIQEVKLLSINLRDERHQPKFDEPQLLAPIDFEFEARRILLVDDRVKSGSTIRFARALLIGKAAAVRTFAVNGKADYALFDEPCFRFPWSV